jgi:hypothetical protein
MEPQVELEFQFWVFVRDDRSIGRYGKWRIGFGL